MIQPPISSLQAALVRDFEALQADPQVALDHLIELGKALPPFPIEERRDANLVAGCLARVWLTHTYKDGDLLLQGDSEAMVTKGLVAVLVHIFSGQRAQDILSADLALLTEIKLPQLLGHQRRAGFGSMLHQVKQYAKQYV